MDNSRIARSTMIASAIIFGIVGVLMLSLEFASPIQPETVEFVPPTPVEVTPRPIATAIESPIVAIPLEGSVVRSPLTVSGSARGMWYFEGSFPAEIQDQNGNTIAIGIMTAQDEWMTEKFVPFTGTLIWNEAPQTTNGILILKRDNPSGFSEYDQFMSVQIRFEK